MTKWMRRLETKKSKGSNSLSNWWKEANPFKVYWNYLLISLSRISPSLKIKRALLRATGMKIGKDVSIGLHAMFDVFFPELIELGEGCIIGYNTTILSHEFMQDHYSKGKTRIGKKAVIGANSTVLAGVDVGDKSVVSAMSLVNKDIEPESFVGGVPCSNLRP